MPPQDYVSLVLQEIRQRQSLVLERQIRSLYFGGGTPSLIPAELIVSIVEELAKCGFEFDSNCETTLEINPATLNPQKIEFYLKAGFNRFSVGAQTFNDRLLKACGREHSAQDTRETLGLLNQMELNYSFDLLFALPGQSLEDLREDLRETLDFGPKHLSAYCLTVPESHPMALGRAPEGEQIEMFELIEEELKGQQLDKYELSNFAQRGRESLHNLSYWTDQSFWGLGLSAHSYLREPGWGVRFWNPKGFSEYQDQVQVRAKQPHTELLDGVGPYALLPSAQKEILKAHEALTDFCHTRLRLKDGLSEDAVRIKWGRPAADSLSLRLKSLRKSGWVESFDNDRWRLTRQGQILSNQVFLALTYLASDLERLEPTVV